MIFLTPISQAIRDELNARMDALGRENTAVNDPQSKELSYTLTDLNSRTPWIKMTSSVKEDDKFITMGTLIDPKTESPAFGIDIYKPINNPEDTDGEGYHKYKPIPGIRDISVEYKGGLKAIRTATINWVCWSLKDIDRFSKSLLSVGKSLLLEWGWATKDDVDNFGYNLNEASLGEIFSGKLYNKIKEGKGNYDAMAGVIKNFNWTARSDGGFDCTTEIVSLGINLFENPKKVYNISGKSEEDGLIMSISNYIEQLDEQLKELIKTNDNLNGVIYTTAELIDRTWVGKMINDRDDSEGIYITWGWFEDNILSRFLGGVSGNEVVQEFRSVNEKSSVKINNHPLLQTTNPGLFILPGQWNVTHDKTQSQIKESVSLLNTQVHFAIDDYTGDLRNIFLNWVVLRDSFTGHSTVEMAINSILTQLNNESGIWNLVLTTDNEKPGRLKVIDTKYGERTVESYLGQDELFSFPSWKHNSLVKSQDLSAEIPSAIALTAMYDVNSDKDIKYISTEDGQALSRSGDRNVVDNMLSNIVPAWQKENFGNKDPYNFTNPLNSGNGFNLKYLDDAVDEEVELIVDDIFAQIQMETAQDPITGIVAAFNSWNAKRKQKKRKKEKEASQSGTGITIEGESQDGVATNEETPEGEPYKNNGFMKDEHANYMRKEMKKKLITNKKTKFVLDAMLNLKIEIDGVGGIIPGNVFTSEYIPELYKKNCIFQAMEVDHTVDNSGWFVTISGKMRMNNKFFREN